MATESDNSRSQIDASDIHFACTPCEKKGKNSEAEYQCIECQSYFCIKCVDHHNQLLSYHNLLDKAAMKKANTAGQKPTSTLPGIPCSVHPEKTIEMYCGQHDVVCCTVCIALKHRSCKGVEFIPTLAKGIGKGNERQQANRNLDSLKKELQQCLTGKKTRLSHLSKQHGNFVKEIKDFKTRLIDIINELERKSIELADTRHTHTTDSIKSDISSLDDMLKMTDAQIDKVNKVLNDNETELFIYVRQSRLHENKANKLLEGLERKTDESMTYEMNTKIESILTDMQTLITIQEEVKHVDTVYTAKLQKNSFNVKVNSDNYKYVIYGCCSLANNHVLITDYKNDKVKSLDSTFNVQDYIDLPGGPHGICKTGDAEVAVSLRNAKKVQFVSVGKQMSKTNSFNVGTCCRGMSHSEGRLYICCGGGRMEPPGHVSVYDKSGKLLIEIQNDNTGNRLFSFPIDVYINPQCSHIYIAEYKGVISINLNDYQSATVNGTKLSRPYSITEDEQGNMLVCGYSSCNVIQIDRLGKVTGTILKESDRIKYPTSLLYLNNPSRLIVCEYESEKIKIFKLR